MKSKGFTLIELMIVVSIIAILASIAIPTFLRFQCRAIGIDAGLNKELTDQLCQSCDTCAAREVSREEAIQSIIDNRASFDTYLHMIEEDGTPDDTPVLEPIPSDTITKVKELESTVQELRVKVLEESLKKLEQREKKLQKVETTAKSWRE